jgi:hypothetical protein
LKRAARSNGRWMWGLVAGERYVNYLNVDPVLPNQA